MVFGAGYSQELAEVGEWEGQQWVLYLEVGEGREDVSGGQNSNGRVEEVSHWQCYNAYGVAC